MDSKNKNSNKKQKSKKGQSRNNDSMVTVADAVVGQSSLTNKLSRVGRVDGLCHSDKSCSGSASSDDEQPVFRHHTAKQKIVRSSTTGPYFNLDKAKQALVEVEQGQMELQAEANIINMTRSAGLAESNCLSESFVASEMAGCKNEKTLEALDRQLKNAIAIVLKVSKVSQSLTGTCSRVLEDAVASIENASATLVNPTSFEEVERLKKENSRLQAENCHLQEENSLLQAEVVDLRNELAELSAGITDEFTRIMHEAENMMNCRFDEFEERLFSERNQCTLLGIAGHSDALSNETVESLPESSTHQQPLEQQIRAHFPEVPEAANIEIANVSAANSSTTRNREDSRPTKYTDVQIVGLDDTMTPEKVVTTVAQFAGCPPNQVKCGRIRLHFRDLRAIVTCPVAVAKKLLDSRTIRFGWIIAKVKLWKPKPPRCFRCFHIGHVGAQCTSDVDRSDICIRCGKHGHSSSGCTGAPHCVLCSAAGKPSNHTIGTNNCGVDSNKLGNKRNKNARKQ